MSFTKTGDAPIQKILCSCGGEIKNGKCEKCGKEPTVSQKEESPQDGK